MTNFPPVLTAMASVSLPYHGGVASFSTGAMAELPHSPRLWRTGMFDPPGTVANFPSATMAAKGLAALTSQISRCGGEDLQSLCLYSFVTLQGNLSAFFEKSGFFVFFFR